MAGVRLTAETGLDCELHVGDERGRRCIDAVRHCVGMREERIIP